MSPPTTAQRSYGVTQGPLWRQTATFSDTSTDRRSYEFSVLIGNTLTSYADSSAYERGDHSTSFLRIVGASAWNPKRSKDSSAETTFRLVTFQGTQVYCTAPSCEDRDLWLAALHAGLEASYSSATSAEEKPLLKSPSPEEKVESRRSLFRSEKQVYCQSCGKKDGDAFHVQTGSSPLFQYGLETRCDLCSECLTGQGLCVHVQTLCDMYASEIHERSALATAREIALKTVWEASPSPSEKPDSNSGASSSQDTNHTHTSSADQSSWTQVGSDGSATEDTENRTTAGSWMGVDPPSSHTSEQQQQQRWIDIPPSAASTSALLDLMKSVQFMSFRKMCPTLDNTCRHMEAGEIGCAAEFFEALDEASGFSRGGDLGALKMEALTVTGDMGTAMKLIHNYALPEEPGERPTEMLTSLLEFLLDLCDDGELGSMAFFWPQLQRIHLRMLPPTNTNELARVELFEDFLLTISARYSIHLAIELAWSYVGDLEDSFYNANASPECRRRRFAVTRFLCELESLVFDFDKGWGGGSVSLRGMLYPSEHQSVLVREGMECLQEHRKRRSPSPCLSRSVRMDKLKKDSFKFSIPPEEAAQEALRITCNADYFSSHISFTRRLGEIAEKLRFMDIGMRSAALERELDLLNSSGSMGGDPLNRVLDKGLMRVVRVPRGEGHVFRSKERTPVLLLMEVVMEGVDEVEDSFDKPDETKIVYPNEEEEAAQDAKSSDLSEQEDVTDEDSEPLAPVSDDEKVPEKDSEHISDADDQSTSSLPTTEVVVEKQEPASPGSAQEADEKEEPESPGTDVIAESAALTSTPPAEQDEDLLHSGSEEESLKDDDKIDEPDSPDAGAVVAPKVVTEGSKPLTPRKSRHALGTLKRFESPVPTLHETSTPTSEKSEMEDLVSSMIDHQLELPALEGDNEEEGSDLKMNSRTLEHNEDSTEPTERKAVRSKSLPNVPSASSPERSSSLKRCTPTRKMSAFGSLGEMNDADTAVNDDIRREVLATIMVKGISGKNVIARGAAEEAQRNLQALDRKRAVNLILDSEGFKIDAADIEAEGGTSRMESARTQLALSLGVDSSDVEISQQLGMVPPSEEDEAMESLRLLLIQNRVAQGSLSAEKAAITLAPVRGASLNQINPKLEGNFRMDDSDAPQIDAGDVDPRLAGCGALPPAVLSALVLYKGDMCSHAELLEIVKKDIQHSVTTANTSKLIEDSAFWGRFAFGERWAEKKARLAASSPKGVMNGWDLLGVIVKSNDDLRQEAFVMQLIDLCQEAFDLAGLDELWLHPYRILSSGRTTGIIEMVRNAMSFDALKKRPGYQGRLRGHLKKMCEFATSPSESFHSMQHNFVRSLASYSVLSHLFMFKDRHNGNMLLDTAGHVIHIDFGFVFGVAPGGSFSLELSTPFKLTEDMVDVMGGLGSPYFSEFVTMFCCGFLALQAYADTFLTIVDITCRGSSFKCFEGRDPEEIVGSLRDRFKLDLSRQETVSHCLDLIYQAVSSYGTKQYDYFQYLSQGIAT